MGVPAPSLPRESTDSLICVCVLFSASASYFLPFLLIFPPLTISHLFLLPLSDVSLRFDQDDYANTEDREQITFTVQRTALGGALGALVNPIEIRVIPVTLDNFDQMRYPPPSDFSSGRRAESK